ncbi:MAG: hypothetical protein WBG35_07645, partial [Acidobacteriaceae bacterium]
MDIEPPHGPIETWRDFFVHLVIITLGLLIALALEGVVGYIHERHLVHEANANITFEKADLNTASWQTAAATHAIAYMRYRDVKRYEDVYGLQADFELAQD